jgi:hypothetical protein
MNNRNWIGTVVGIQLANAFLLFAFSIYLAVEAYPLVAFFEERNVTLTYIANVAVFVVLGVLLLAGWLRLRKDKFWGWRLALFADAVICITMTLDSLSLGLRKTYFQPATIDLLSAAGVSLLLMPAVRKQYSSHTSMQV